MAERLQLTDTTDPLLIDGHITLTIRVRADESVILASAVEEIDVPAPGPRGAVVNWISISDSSKSWTETN